MPAPAMSTRTRVTATAIHVPWRSMAMPSWSDVGGGSPGNGWDERKPISWTRAALPFTVPTRERRSSVPPEADGAHHPALERPASDVANVIRCSRVRSPGRPQKATAGSAPRTSAGSSPASIGVASASHTARSGWESSIGPAGVSTMRYAGKSGFASAGTASATASETAIRMTAAMVLPAARRAISDTGMRAMPVS